MKPGSRVSLLQATEKKMNREQRKRRNAMFRSPLETSNPTSPEPENIRDSGSLPIPSGTDTGNPLLVRNEPSEQPPVLEPTTPANPVADQQIIRTCEECQEAPLSPALEFSEIQSLQPPLSPPALLLDSESTVPEPGSECPNPMLPLSILALFASQMSKSVVLVPESEPQNPGPVERRPRTVRKPRTKKVQPRNPITSESLPKKTRTKRQTSEPECENQSLAQKRPRTRKKPRTSKKPHTIRKTPGGLTVVSGPDPGRNPNRVIEIEASQIDTNEGDEEVSDTQETEMAPPESDTRNSQTPASPDVQTQETPFVRNMIPVSVYAGGEVQFNQMGAEYSIPPMLTFVGTQQTTFEDVRNEINNCLKLSEDQFSLNIQARYNAVPNGPFFFALLAINDDRAWQLIYEMAVSGLNWRIIELFVKLVPNQSSQNANPDPTHSHGTSSVPESALMHAMPSLDMSYDHPMGRSSRSQQVPKQTSPNYCISNPTSSPHISSVSQQIMPMSANPSQTMPHNAPARDSLSTRDSCSRPNLIPVRSPTMSSRTRHKEHMHAKPTRTKKYSSLSQGQGPSSSELIPFANVGSFSANQIFKSKKHLWFAITDLHIKSNSEIAVISNSESEFVVRCKNERCQWKLHATPTRLCSNWMIKTCLHPHTCHEAMPELIQPEVTVELTARIIRSDIEQNSELKIIKLHELVLKIFPGEQVSYRNLWHARKMVIEELFGGWEESYALLARLFEAIKASNPETKFDLQSDSMTQSGNQQFNHVAWAFGPCINAYRFLRPVISVKALSLLGKYDGRLLIACGYDADNQPVPLAFALVNEETESNWTWFMRFLRQEVIGHNQLVCVISDCDSCIKNAFKGPYNYLVKAMQQTVHRFCSQNVADCLSKVCKDIELIDIFKFAAQKTSPRKFEEGMNAIRIRSPETYLYLQRLMKRKPHDQYEHSSNVKWAQHEDGGYRYGIMNSNCLETVKKVFKGCRHLPVAAIVENTFSNCMSWFSQRRRNASEQVASGNDLPDTVTRILQKRGDKAQRYNVNCSAFYRKVYEVAVKRTRVNCLTFLKYNVIVASRSTPECECQKLEFTGIPCSHVIAVCHKRNIDPKRFVNSYYSLQMLVDTWSADFHLYGNQTEWPEYNGAVIVPDKTLLRTGPRKPENPKDSGQNSGKQPNSA